MKKFLLAMLIVVGNLFLMPVVDAETKTYTGTDEYVIGETETPETAKENSKIRAMRNAQDQAGVFIRSRSRMKDLELVEDEIVTLTEGILRVVGAPVHEVRLLGDGKGILIFTTIKVEIDTDDLDRRLAEIARTHSANKVPIDRPKPLENPVTPAQMPEVDNIALSKQKFDVAIKARNDGRYDEAIIFFTQAIELNPNNADFYNERGSIYGDNLNEYQKAVDDFSRAIQIAPNHKWAWRNRGLNYYRLGNYAQTVSDCTKALEVNPNYAHAYRNRGRTYQHLKNYSKAIEDLSAAIKFDARYLKAYVNRGECYQALGEHDKARADFDKARQLGWNG